MQEPQPITLHPWAKLPPVVELAESALALRRLYLRNEQFSDQLCGVAQRYANCLREALDLPQMEEAVAKMASGETVDVNSLGRHILVSFNSIADETFVARRQGDFVYIRARNHAHQVPGEHTGRGQPDDYVLNTAGNVVSHRTEPGKPWVLTVDVLRRIAEGMRGLEDGSFVGGRVTANRVSFNATEGGSE